MHRALSLILLLVALATPALAQGTGEDQRAKELYENGAVLYEEGRYEDAIEAWQEAYRLSKRPLLLFNIANAQERIGLWRDALETLNRYRAFATAGERDVLDRRMNNIERRVAEQEAAEAAARQAEEAERQQEEEEAASATSEAPLTPRPTTPTATDTRPLRGVGLGLLVGGLAGAGVGGGFSAAALAKRQEIEGTCKEAGGALFCPQSAVALEDEEALLSTVGDVALIAGGAVAGAGLVLVLIDAGTAGKVPVAVAPTPGGFVVAGRF